MIKYGGGLVTRFDSFPVKGEIPKCSDMLRLTKWHLAILGDIVVTTQKLIHKF